MCCRSKRAERHLLFLLLVIIGVSNSPVQSGPFFIQGELDVLISDSSHPPVFVVRDGRKIHPVIAPDHTISRLISYAGYNVGLRSLPAPPASNFEYLGDTAASSALPGSAFSYVESIDISGPADKNFSESAAVGAQNISTVVYLLRFCGWEAPVNAITFRTLWVNTPSTPSTTNTMQNFWANCSHGLARMDARDQVIVEVKLPCTGNISDKDYDFANKCRDVELYAWMHLAEDYTREQLGIDTTAIKQRIAVLPSEAGRNCPWDGMGEVGCSGTRCYSWINGRLATDLSAYMKGMGHNFGLMLSGSWDSHIEDADATCSMGSGSSCYNMANLWRLGWATQVSDGDLNLINFAAGTWKKFQLPYATHDERNHIRIVPNWAPTTRATFKDMAVEAHPAYYVSLRAREGFDMVPRLTVPDPGRVLVHSSQAKQVVSSFQKTRLEAILDVGGTYPTQLPFGIVVRVKSISTDSGATVSVCHADVTMETGLCNDGLDNDCDGLTDGQDSDCNPSSFGYSVEGAGNSRGMFGFCSGDGAEQTCSLTHE